MDDLASLVPSVGERLSLSLVSGVTHTLVGGGGPVFWVSLSWTPFKFSLTELKMSSNLRPVNDPDCFKLLFDSVTRCGFFPGPFLDLLEAVLRPGGTTGSLGGAGPWTTEGKCS